MLPVAVTIVVPVALLAATRSIHPVWTRPLPIAVALSALSVAFLCSGSWLLAETISLFSRIGKGTLAPWDPPVWFVVKGSYRYVRNPMITGVFVILLGETILLGSGPLFYWFLSFTAGNLLYVPLLEEPGLERRFGDAYRNYKAHVPRWVPRLSPWNAPPESPCDELR
jgi:protein-S-isoprenylcysteine O-methyltransferase Ste14